MKTEIAVNRAFTDQCIELHSQGKLDGGMASMCKYWITDLQNRIAYEGVQLHGGWGYMWEYPICRAYVDAKVRNGTRTWECSIDIAMPIIYLLHVDASSSPVVLIPSHHFAFRSLPSDIVTQLN